MAGGVKRRFQPQVCPHHDRNAYLEGRLSIRGITDGRCAEAISALRRTVLSHCCRTTAYWCSAQWDGRSAAFAEVRQPTIVLRKADFGVKQVGCLPTFGVTRRLKQSPLPVVVRLNLINSTVCKLPDSGVTETYIAWRPLAIKFR